MAFESLTEEETATDKPGSQSLFRKIKDNLDALNGQIGSLASVDIPNGSFEIDSEGNGDPDSWSGGQYPGGTTYIDTVTPPEGDSALAFQHPGGASNGGGWRDSDYVPCAEQPEILGVIHFATATGMRNQVIIRYFDKGKVFVSSETLYDSTHNPTSPAPLLLGFTPPATARYYKVRLVGGYTDTDVTGFAVFDRVTRQPFLFANQSTGQSVSLAQLERSSAEYSDVGFFVLNTAGNLPVRVKFTAQVSGPSGSIGYMRFRVDGLYSNEISKSGIGYGPVETMTIDLDGAAGDTQGEITVHMQLKSAAGGQCFGKVDANVPTRRITDITTIFP